PAPASRAAIAHEINTRAAISALRRHARLTGSRIVLPQFVSVTCGRRIDVELGMGIERARLPRCGDQRQKHHHTTEHQQSAEHEDADQQYGVSGGHSMTTRSRSESDPRWAASEELQHPSL